MKRDQLFAALAACAMLHSNWNAASAAQSTLGTTVEMLSTASRAVRSGAGDSYSPTFSGDGRSLAFISRAQNLVTNGVPSKFLDAYVYRLETREIILASPSAFGSGGGNEDS